MSKQHVVETLNKSEKQEFRKCEAVIRRGVKTFVEVGTALKRIQEGQLYRESHTTFDEYCKDRWEMSRAHAYRLIESAKVVEDVAPTGSAPKNESQARPLSRLRSAQARQEAWKEAEGSSGSGEVTAKAVEAAVARVKKAESGEGVEPDDGVDPMKLTICSDPDGIACWLWHPVTLVNNFPTLHEKRLGAPQYTSPPKNSQDPEDSTVVICPEFDLFQSKTPDSALEAVLEAAEKSPHWTFLLFSKNYERLFSYALPEHIWAGARISSSVELVQAEKAALRGKTSTKFLYFSPLTDAVTLSVPLPFQWIIIGGSDPQPEWEHVWGVTAQAVDINVPILWAESLEVRPSERPDFELPEEKSGT